MNKMHLYLGILVISFVVSNPYISYGVNITNISINPNTENKRRILTGKNQSNSQSLSIIGTKIDLQSRDNFSKSGSLINSKSGSLNTSKSGSLNTSKSGSLNTSKSGTLNTSKSGSLNTSKSGSLNTSKSGSLNTSKSGETSQYGIIQKSGNSLQQLNNLEKSGLEVLLENTNYKLSTPSIQILKHIHMIERKNYGAINTIMTKFLEYENVKSELSFTLTETIYSRKKAEDKEKTTLSTETFVKTIDIPFKPESIKSVEFIFSQGQPWFLRIFEKGNQFAFNDKSKKESAFKNTGRKLNYLANWLELTEDGKLYVAIQCDIAIIRSDYLKI